jgi:D-threo-aldose 1-dehydrogenase
MDPLHKTTLGASDVPVTSLGLGTAPLGGWPAAVTPEDGLATVRAAWDVGLRYFDTAPFYGYGQSERWVGEVLRDQPRSSFTLSTKMGRLLVPAEETPALFHGDHHLTAVFDFSYDGAMRSLEESLQRMGLDRVDVALIHDPDDELDEALDGTYRALHDLRSQGVVGAIGAGMNWIEPLVYLASRADFDCILLAGRYTILEQESLDELLPLALEKQFSIVAGGVFNSGVLVDPSAGATYNYAEAPDDIVARARRIHDVCARHGVDPKAAALQFPLAHPAVSTIVTGARTAAEIEANAALMAAPLPSELWEDLRSAGLLREDAPTPAA